MAMRRALAMLELWIASGIPIHGSTRVLGGTAARLLAWYNNKWGDSCRPVDLPCDWVSDRVVGLTLVPNTSYGRR
jgi:hypothetical protein